MGKQKNDKKNFQRGVKGSGTALKISKFNEISTNCHGIGFNNHGSSVITDKRKFAASDKKNNEFDDKMRNLRERNLKQSKQKKIVKIQDPTFLHPSQDLQKKEQINIGNVAIDSMFIGDTKNDSLTHHAIVSTIDNDSNSSICLSSPRMNKNPNIFDALSIDDDISPETARLQLLQNATFTFESNQSLLFSND